MYATSTMLKPVVGTGSTLAAPIMNLWMAEFGKETGIKLAYRSTGSAAGMQQRNSNDIDFIATEVPYYYKTLRGWNLGQYPVVVAAIVIVFNVPGVKSGDLVLDGEVLGDIFLGRITKWNDERLTNLNPSIDLPNKFIHTVHRVDGSGSTNSLTAYLSRDNKNWRDQLGAGDTIKWPTGLPAKGTDGMLRFIKRVSGSIGYIEYGHAKRNSLTYANLFSTLGDVLEPVPKSFASAMREKDYAPALTYNENKLSICGTGIFWPMTCEIIMLVRIDAPKERKQVVSEFFEWAVTSGVKHSEDLDLWPLPNFVAKKVVQLLKSRYL